MVTSSEVIPRAPNTICWRRLWCIGPSQISQTSLASRSLYFARMLARCGDPASSSPSKTNLTLARSGIPDARGITSLDITIYGPKRELHSGHYGNWAPNPAMMLARLLASMKDDDGRVTIDRFYDGIEPLSETERRAIAEAPDVDLALMRELWLGRSGM